MPVTKSVLTPLEEYLAHLKRAYNNEWLTNRGELVIELEEKLKNFLGAENVLITNNGTVPLQIALKLLGNGGEVITTPFSYVATTSAIVWESCTPIFVDIDPEYLTIDETKIEEAITKKTTCILATHVFGNPCKVDIIETIAKKYNLKIVYDGAHCFGTKYKGKSIFDYGDVSTCSFHATKLFHTGEGGAIFCKDGNLMNRIFYSHNFGHNGPHNFHGLGINAKMSELNSAMGLAVFPYIDEIISTRKRIVENYDSNLSKLGINKVKIREYTDWNYSYYPVIFESEDLLLKIQNHLNKHNIYPRRYFYPSLNNLPYVENVPMPISDSVSKRILCLPLFYDLQQQEIEAIITIIRKVLC